MLLIPSNIFSGKQYPKRNTELPRRLIMSHVLISPCHATSYTSGLPTQLAQEVKPWYQRYIWGESSPLCWSNYIIRKYVLPIWSEHNYTFSHRIVHWVYNYMFQPCILAIIRLYCKLNKQLYNTCVEYSRGERDLVPPEYPTHIQYSWFLRPIYSSKTCLVPPQYPIHILYSCLLRPIYSSKTCLVPPQYHTHTYCIAAC
jgi:hypothetical protein